MREDEKVREREREREKVRERMRIDSKRWVSVASLNCIVSSDDI